MASVVLHLCHPDPYPIADIRAMWSLGQDTMPSYSRLIWLEYVSAFRDICATTGESPRRVDRALWQYSSEQGRAALT